MSVRETLLIDVACDIAGCSHSIACGNSYNYAEENGWKLSVPVDNSHKDLCPECYADLKAFTDGNPDDEADVMSLHDVLAGEQPHPEDAIND
jgi:hypothetical protein